MSRMFMFSNRVDRPIYRASRTIAMRQAREVSREVDRVVEVEEITLNDNLPRLQLIEACLNETDWGSGQTQRIAAFQGGKAIDLEAA